MKKNDLKNYFNGLIESIDFSESFDFDETIKILPNFRSNFIRIIKHAERIDRVILKEKSFIVSIPEDGYDFGNFEKGKSYKIILWNILKDGPSKRDIIMKMSQEQEGEPILGGMNGLNILETYAKDEIPFDRIILSFSTKERESVSSFCLHENSNSFEYGVLGLYGTIINKRNLLVSFYKI